MGEIISTITTGKDRKLERVKTDEEKDFPLKEVDQSKVCSTRNIIPNKREVEKRDVEKFTNRAKEIKKVEKEQKATKKKEQKAELKDKKIKRETAGGE